MNTVKWPCSPWVLVAHWIERPSSVREVMHGFDSCRRLRFFLCFTLVFCWSVDFSHFITELKIYHLYSFTIKWIVSIQYWLFLPRMTVCLGHLYGNIREQVTEIRLSRMRNYVTCSKFASKPRLGDIFSNFRFLLVVFTWVFFSSLLLWELVHDNI